MIIYYFIKLKDDRPCVGDYKKAGKYFSRQFRNQIRISITVNGELDIYISKPLLSLFLTDDELTYKHHSEYNGPRDCNDPA